MNTWFYIGLFGGFILGFFIGIGAISDLIDSIKTWRNSLKKQYRRHGLELGDYAFYDFEFSEYYDWAQTYPFEIVDGDTKKTKVRWQLDERWFDLDDKVDIEDLICWVKSDRWYPESSYIHRRFLYNENFPTPIELKFTDQ